MKLQKFWKIQQTSLKMRSSLVGSVFEKAVETFLNCDSLIIDRGKARVMPESQYSIGGEAAMKKIAVYFCFLDNFDWKKTEIWD